MIVRLPSMPLTLVMLTLLTLGGCKQYSYVPPDTEVGKLCVKDLDARTAQCSKLAEEDARSQRASYDFAMIGYRACTQQTPSSAQNPYPCGSAPINPGPADGRICRRDYKASFVKCGGRLEEIVDK